MLAAPAQAQPGVDVQAMAAQVLDPPATEPRGNVFTGSLTTPCVACQDFEVPILGRSVGGNLVSSVSFANGFDPGTNGVDGHWFDITGLAGSTFTLQDAGSEAPAAPWPQDIRFFAGPFDTQDIELGGFNGPDMPKEGKVPAGANFAFVYARWPSGDAIWPAVPQLTVAAEGLPPGPPLDVVATAGASSVTLTWSPPAGAPLITSYLIQGGSQSGSYTSTSSPPSSPASISGLEAHVAHYFVVRAVSGAGTGAASAEVSAIPFQDESTPSPTFAQPLDGAEVDPSVTFAGAYTPGLAGSAFDNTHYLFLLNLNGECGDALGYGDHVILSKLVAHAVGTLGVPAANVWIYNEMGGALSRGRDSAHYDLLPSSWKSGSAYDGPATIEAFEAGLTQAAFSAAAGEASGGAPARLVVITSTHGIHNPYNARAADGTTGDRLTGSAMCLAPFDLLSDKGFGDVLNAAIHGAEERSAVAIESAILIDCSFCGGFIDRPVQGVPTTAIVSAGVVGPGRVVEVGCSWLTECFGNPASTYNHMFSQCTFTGAADGYGPLASVGAGVGDAFHHDPDGVVTLEEAYWCATVSALDSSAAGWAATDPQQQYQIDDQLSDDVFASDAFVLWDTGSDQNLAAHDWLAPVPPAGAVPTSPETVDVTFTGPAGQSASEAAVLDPVAGTWTLDPRTLLGSGSWTATVTQSAFGRVVAGPSSIVFHVAPGDADGDGVGDETDVCAGGDDALDLDGDGTADGCDVDRDGDGCSNDIEAVKGTDPDNAASVPKKCRATGPPDDRGR